MNATSDRGSSQEQAEFLGTLDQLRDENELLLLGMEATGAGFFDYDPRTGRKYWSARTRGHFGVNEDRQPSHDLFIQCLHPDDRQRVAEIVRNVLRPGSDGFYHTRYRTVGLDDGQLRHISATGRVLFNSVGDAIRFIGTTVDVTRQQALEEDIADRTCREAELRTLNARFKMALRGAPVVLFCQDLNLRYTWIHNPALGYDAASVIGKRDIDLFERPEDAQLLEQIKRSVIETGRSRRQEVTLSSGGSLQCYDLLVDPLIESGKLAGVRCAALDISAVKNAERQAREAQERLRLGLAVAGLALAEVDYRTGLNHLTAEAARLFGLGEEAISVPREKVHGTFHPDDRAELAQRIAQCLDPASQGWFAMDHRVVWPDGQVHWLRVRKQIFFEGEGSSRQPVRATLAAMDITDVSDAKIRAETASRAKDRFLATLSHELRTPLAPVLASLELLQDDASLSAEHREMTEMIRRNVELEVRLVDDLLDITRISSSKLRLKPSLLDAHEKIRQVITICHEDSATKELDVSFHPAAAMHRVQADSARFQQIIWNLLKNAIKFTPFKGKIQITTTNTTSGYLEIAVSDNGVGISPTALPKIFDAFEQGGDQVTQHFGGLGLGLAISDALARMHHGTLRADSGGVGKGATFTLSIPCTEDLTAPKRGSRSSNSKSLSCSILLVEDHADTRRVMVRLLKTMGCQVEPAGSVAEALEAAAKFAFNLVISDIGLPDGSGIELIRQLKQRYNVKGIALSGYGMDEDLIRSRDAGFDSHLVKPVDVQELEDTIRQLTDAQNAAPL
jgi:signal transduction histidine kinase/CheY-like chemotaxis protein